MAYTKKDEKKVYEYQPPEAKVPETTDHSIDPDSLGKASAVTAAKVAKPVQQEYDKGSVFGYGAYKPSEQVLTYEKALGELKAPDAYESKWQGQIDDIIGKIMNREEFSYDYNEDALYKQYADQYRRNAELMAADTTGRAASMTGGYGNSWASTVGASAYAAEMQKLNDKIPELYALALDRYNAEGDAMLNKYGLLTDQEATDYGRYRDEYGDYITERDYLTGRYDTERDFDYGKYVDDRDFAYGEFADRQARLDDIITRENDTAMELYKVDNNNAYLDAELMQSGIKYDNDAVFEAARLAADEEARINDTEMWAYEKAVDNYWSGVDADYRERALDEDIAHNDAVEGLARDEFEYGKAVDRASLYAEGGDFASAAALLGVDAETVKAAYASPAAESAAAVLGYKDVYELTSNIGKLVNGYKDANENIPTYGGDAVAEMYATSDLNDEQFAAVLNMIEIADPEFDSNGWLDTWKREHPESDEENN